MSSFFRGITTRSAYNRDTAFVAAGIVAAIWLSVGAWRTGRAQRTIRILWEGDQEGQRRTWGLEYVRRAREYVDELGEKIADAETEARHMVEARHREQDQVAGSMASNVTNNERRNRLAKKLSGLSNNIDEAFQFLDGIQGDQVVREARKDQVQSLSDRTLSRPGDRSKRPCRHVSSVCCSIGISICSSEVFFSRARRLEALGDRVDRATKLLSS